MIFSAYSLQTVQPALYDIPAHDDPGILFPADISMGLLSS
jgi:hypothetical protein